MAVIAALPLQAGARAVSQSPDARILAAINHYALQRRAKLVERILGRLELIGKRAEAERNGSSCVKFLRMRSEPLLRKSFFSQMRMRKRRSFVELCKFRVSFPR